MRKPTLLALLLPGLLWLSACQNQPGAAITVNAKGEMTAFGQPAADLETLKSLLVDSLANLDVLPERLSVHFEGELGMGLRQEVETIATEALEAARLAKIAPTVETLSYRQEQGTDCDKPDSLRTFCAVLDLQYPSVVKGEKALQDSVNQWATRYLAALLDGGEKPQATTLDAGAATFFKNHAAFKGTPMGGSFEYRTGSDVLLNNGKYLTLAIHGETYQGGAHGLQTQAIRTFDAQTGRALTWADLVTDPAAVKALAEKKVREARADVFQDGFNFDSTFPFVLPAAYGLTEEGLFLYYVPYEIMPYAMGETEVSISLEELGPLAKW